MSGSSWKPLPVLFTAPFSVFGDAAPQLWILVVRAGALLAVLFAFRVASRLAGTAARGGGGGAPLVPAGAPLLPPGEGGAPHAGPRVVGVGKPPNGHPHPGEILR